MEQCYMFKINEKETTRRVRERLETARLFKRFGFIRKEVKVTATYEDMDMPRSFTGITSDPTASASIYNVDQEERLQKQYEQVMRALRMLSRRQREIIERRYLDDEDVLDTNVFVDMCISERTYYYEKEKALYRLAFALRLEVYEEV